MTMFSPKPRFDLGKFLQESATPEAKRLAKSKRNFGYPSYPKPAVESVSVNTMLNKTR